MTGKGTLTTTPNRRLRSALALQTIWLIAVFVLGAWWWTLLERQASRISELEQALGMTAAAAESQWMRTQRMLYWESLTFLLLLLIITGSLFWLYWRDAKRTRSIGAFFASVTHELRTPLTSIRLQAESIAESLPKGSSDQALVQRLLEDSARLESQVERTLELARVEGGGRLLAEPLDVRPWCDRVFNAARQTYGDRLRIEAKLPHDLVHADPTALQVIVRNLLENSIRHGGTDRAQPEQSRPVTVTVSNEDRGDRTLIRFRDDGRGFSGDASQLGQIFQKGQGSQGAGVGLYLARALMERMGGQATFSSGTGFFETTLSFRKAPEPVERSDA